MRIWLAALLCPGLCLSQEVKPVTSEDYLSLIRGDTLSKYYFFQRDSLNDIRQSRLRLHQTSFLGLQVNKIHTNPNNTIQIREAKKSYIAIGGNINLETEWQQANRRPRLQEEYVQGRSLNGKLRWQGPETGEALSYGPSTHSLIYTGNNYVWDANGQLTEMGMTGGSPASAYKNVSVRNGFSLKPSLSVQTRYYKGYLPILTLSLRAGTQYQKGIIQANTERANHFGGTLLYKIKTQFEFNAHYSFREQKMSFSNRVGFLSRIYQTALLNPASLDPQRGYMSQHSGLASSPPGYTPVYAGTLRMGADMKNPGYNEKQYTSGFSAEWKRPRFTVKVTPSGDVFTQYSREGFSNESAFFPIVKEMIRRSTDSRFTLNSSINANSRYNGTRFRYYTTFVSMYSQQHYQAEYEKPSLAYNHSRRIHETSFSISSWYRYRSFDAYLMVHNKTYNSSTTSGLLLLPGISAAATFVNPLEIEYCYLKFQGSYQQLVAEASIRQPVAGYQMTQYSLENAKYYFPVSEIENFQGLTAIRKRDWSASVELNGYNKFRFYVNWFIQNTKDDVLPLVITNRILLKNMAAYTNKGFEIELTLNPFNWNSRKKKIELLNTISFVSYRNKVTSIREGYEGHKMAGFSNVYKALIIGETPGMIMGNTWQRNVQGEKIIGSDGFPIKDPVIRIIGDPNPDFIMKFSHTVKWETKWSLNIDLEWRKGGETWNGTAALLDYFGRSASSASQRNIRGYIFNGVTTNGNHNNMPVDFYNPASPVEQNRWMRYGLGGVAEDYIQKADCIRIHNISVVYKPKMKNSLRQLSFTLYATNIMLWSAYQGVDPRQLLNDQPETSGLDYFNLPAVRAIGFSTTIQF